jgi:hypothetical protein
MIDPVYHEQSSSPLGHGIHLLIQCIVGAIRNSLRVIGCGLAAWRLAAYPWRSGRKLYLRNGKRYQRNFNGYPTFSTTPTSLELFPRCPMSVDHLKSIWRPSNRKLIVSGTLSTDPICYLHIRVESIFPHCVWNRFYHTLVEL